MKFRVEIDTDGAAFDGGWEEELGRILDALAAQILDYELDEDTVDTITLIDGNGNTVGKACFTYD